MVVGKEAWAQIAAANPRSPTTVAHLFTVKWNGITVRGYFDGTANIGGKSYYAITVCVADRAAVKKKGYNMPTIIVPHEDVILK